MRKLVASSILAIVAVCAMLGVASASVVSSAIDTAVAAVDVQMDTIAVTAAHCGSCGSDEKPAAVADSHCGCKDKCGSKCGSCKPKCGCKSKCGCEKKSCGCKDKCGSKCGSCKPKCCDKPKCGCEKQSCGCEQKCCPECCPKQVENYPDANRGAEGEWARDGLSRQRA
jgi:hypothetical protein